MTTLLDRLSLDHARLTRLLDLLWEFLDRFHQGSEPDYALTSEVLAYLETYEDQIHHPSEEVIFDRLRALGASHPALAVLTKQHAFLGQLNRRFRQSLEGIVNGEVLRREDVERQGRELVQALREHMALEDTEAFPLAREQLCAEDWEQALQAAPSAEDPLFGTLDTARFKSLFQALATRTGEQ